MASAELEDIYASLLAEAQAEILEEIKPKIERLQLLGEEILATLMELPPQFRMSEGGGWSFLNACNDRDGNLWGQHINIEQLLLLGIGAGLAKILLPREMWKALPGGMPYFGVLDEAKKK